MFARRYEALAWFLPRDFHLVSLSFSLSPHLSLFIDTGSLLFASRHPAPCSFPPANVGLSSTELAFKPVRRHRWIEGPHQNRLDNPSQRFHGGHKSLNKSALSYCYSPTGILDLFCRFQKVYTTFSGITLCLSYKVMC